MKFNKKSIMAISLVVGAVMLSTSAFANYINSSGYTACKEAGKKLLKENQKILQKIINLIFIIFYLGKKQVLL